MAQWGNVDNAANSAIFALAQVSKNVASSDDRTELFGNTTADVYFTGATVGQFGVDTDETAAANGVTHAGWVLRTEGSGGRAGRVHYETLVAMGSMSGDDEDTSFPDYRIIITSQPSDSEETSGDPASFTIVATTTPTGGALTYQWQSAFNGTDSTGPWANIANSGVYASENDTTSPTLSISDNTDLDGNVYRVLVYVDGGTTAISANASLTEA